MSLLYSPRDFFISLPIVEDHRCQSFFKHCSCPIPFIILQPVNSTPLACHWSQSVHTNIAYSASKKLLLLLWNDTPSFSLTVIIRDIRYTVSSISVGPVSHSLTCLLKVGCFCLKNQEKLILSLKTASHCNITATHLDCRRLSPASVVWEDLDSGHGQFFFVLHYRSRSVKGSLMTAAHAQIDNRFTLKQWGGDVQWFLAFIISEEPSCLAYSYWSRKKVTSSCTAGREVKFGLHQSLLIHININKSKTDGTADRRPPNPVRWAVGPRWDDIYAFGRELILQHWPSIYTPAVEPFSKR